MRGWDLKGVARYFSLKESVQCSRKIRNQEGIWHPFDQTVSRSPVPLLLRVFHISMKVPASRSYIMSYITHRIILVYVFLEDSLARNLEQRRVAAV